LIRLAELAHRAGAETALQPRATLHVLDWMACSACGADSAQGRAFAQWLQQQGAGDRATLAGRRSDAAAAAAYHGALGSVLEMDDIHRSSILHPGPVVIPAVLAAASPATPGARLLAGVQAGYEAVIRVGRALGPSHYDLWHSTATAGCFGAAAGAAVVMGLDVTGTAHAMALAGTRGGGLWQVRHERSLGKSWHMAGAARDGLAAAQLAAVGLTGPLAILEGPSGWFAATAPQAEAERVHEARERPWLEDVSFKPWPACRHAHPAMDALRECLTGVGLAAADVAAVNVETYADALRFCDRPLPQDEAQARFSIQHALAAWLLWGEPRFEHYAPAAINDPALAALRARVQVQQSDEYQSRYPAHYGARVRIECHDGRVLSAALSDCWGDPARPMPDAAVRHKAQRLMAHAGWAPQRIAAALAATEALPLAADLIELENALQP
jgi:2-methylcitrate dehydratase PrpD